MQRCQCDALPEAAPLTQHRARCAVAAPAPLLDPPHLSVTTRPRQELNRIHSSAPWLYS
jgi:hypothetical protein